MLGQTPFGGYKGIIIPVKKQRKENSNSNPAMPSASAQPKPIPTSALQCYILFNYFGSPVLSISILVPCASSTLSLYILTPLKTLHW